jgi:hypothetical protein
MFGFSEATHKTYKHNFLRKIEIKFLFSPISLEENDSLIKKCLISLFPDYQLEKKLNFIFDIENKNEVIENKGAEEEIYFIFKKDKSSLQINKDSFILKINGSEYQSFKNITFIIEKIVELSSLLKIDVFKVISFNKLNILELKEVEDLSNVSYYAHHEYINSEIRKPNSHNLVINDFRTLSMKNVDEKADLMLKYGLNSPTNEQGKLKHLFIQIDITTQDILKNDVITTLKKVNKELFNVFNWTISYKLINLLEND